MKPPSTGNFNDKPVEVVPETETTKEKKSRIMPAGKKITQPNPAGKKGQVVIAGQESGGASIEALAKQMNCTTSNIRQHITQANTNLGYGFEILGDNFKIIGTPTDTWESQAKIKAEKAEVKKAEAEVKKAEAEAKKAKDDKAGKAES